MYVDIRLENFYTFHILPYYTLVTSLRLRFVKINFCSDNIECVNVNIVHSSNHTHNAWEAAIYSFSPVFNL